MIDRVSERVLVEKGAVTLGGQSLAGGFLEINTFLETV